MYFDLFISIDDYIGCITKVCLVLYGAETSLSDRSVFHTSHPCIHVHSDKKSASPGSIQPCCKYVWSYKIFTDQWSDRSKCFTFYTLTYLFIPTPTRLLWKEVSLLQTLREEYSLTCLHVTIPVYSQVLIYTAE